MQKETVKTPEKMPQKKSPQPEIPEKKVNFDQQPEIRPTIPESPDKLYEEKLPPEHQLT